MICQANHTQVQVCSFGSFFTFGWVAYPEGYDVSYIADAVVKGDGGLQAKAASRLRSYRLPLQIPPLLGSSPKLWFCWVDCGGDLPFINGPK